VEGLCGTDVGSFSCLNYGRNAPSQGLLRNFSRIHLLYGIDKIFVKNASRGLVQSIDRIVPLSMPDGNFSTARVR
jgi:hypothetical protein